MRYFTCTNSNLRVMLLSCVTMDWFLFLFFLFFACFLFMMFCRSRQGMEVLADSHAFYYNCTVYLSYYLLMDSQNVGRETKHMRKKLLFKKACQILLLSLSKMMDRPLISNISDFFKWCELRFTDIYLFIVLQLYLEETRSKK